MRRFWILISMLSLLAAGCGGGGAAADSTTTSTTQAPSTTTTRAPATTSTTTSTTAAATTTTTGAPGAVTLAGLVPPTEVLDGFRFVATALEDEGEFGFLNTGTFVAPDAVECTIAYPHLFMSPTLGTLVAIGDEAWWQDDMGTNPNARDDDFVTEGFADCPGAPEFWDAPLMSEGLLALGAEEEGEEIAGFPTVRVTLTSLDPEVMLKEAALWVTPAGWPIKMEVHGTVEGGIGRALGWDNELPEGELAFTLGFELTDIGLGSLMVRSPDGSAVAGPLGGVEASLPDLPAPSEGLQAALALASRQECVGANVPLDLLAPFGTEARLGDFSVAGVVDIGGYQATQLNPGTFVISGPDDKVSTGAEGELGRAHAILVFAHLAPLVHFFELVSPSPLPADDSGRLDLAVWSGAGGLSGPDDDTPRLATWDGSVIDFAEFPDEPTNATELLHAYFAMTPMPEEVLAEAWERADGWALPVLEAALRATEGDPQAIADLQAASGQLADMNALGCALLGHGWSATEDLMGSGGNQGALLAAFAGEEKAQSLLQFLDYIEVMIHYLELPEVDWLDAEGVSLDNTMFTDNSAAEYLGVIALAAQDAVGMMGFFSE